MREVERPLGGPLYWLVVMANEFSRVFKSGLDILCQNNIVPLWEPGPCCNIHGGGLTRLYSLAEK